MERRSPVPGGYHSLVYYAGFNQPPAGARFSQQDGLRDGYSSETRGDWREYSRQDVLNVVPQLAGNPDLAPVREQESLARKELEVAGSEIESILSAELARGDDPFLSKLLDELRTVQPSTINDAVKIWQPRGQFMSTDIEALGAGLKVPPRTEISADVASINHNFGICKTMAMLARKAGSHLARKTSWKTRDERVGTNVFIGHGRSAAWRELKDFINERLRLPYDEFNRVPVAGISNIARLSETGRRRRCIRHHDR